MCNSKSKPTAPTSISDINGRPVLQPAGNRVSLLERRTSLSNTNNSSPSSNPKLPSPLKSPRPPAIKRSGANHNNNINTNNTLDLNSSVGDNKPSPPSPTSATRSPTAKTLKKSKQSSTNNLLDPARLMSPGLDISFLMAEAPPGSIAAARREQVAIMQVQRKMKTAHYGRTKSAKYLGKVLVADSATASASDVRDQEIKRCSFITSNSDPIYIAYHDEEWGVPVHDDKMLFELLILTAAQLGSDWTSVLKKRQDFREAFSGFDAEIVSAYSEKRITSIVADYGIKLSQVRGAVDNANRILVIRREFGSLDKYSWNFVNQKPMQTQYKSSNKIPVKTSKSEAMSKDLVRRGFRYVGATVMLSFMQAAGLTNDHLLDCPRHQHCCLAAAASKPS